METPPKRGTSAEADQIRLDSLKRKARLDAWNDYISFGVNKFAGLSSVIGGVADLIHPSLVPQMHHPEYALGAGLALLGGKSVLTFVKKLVVAIQ